MTTPARLLSVRLDPELAAALSRHCEQSGASRTDVVKQSIAQYLVSQTGPTLGSLAEAVLPPLPKAGRVAAARESRQTRYRDHVREKRRR